MKNQVAFLLTGGVLALLGVGFSTSRYAQPRA
jgi:hypothetical protein